MLFLFNVRFTEVVPTIGGERVEVTATLSPNGFDGERALYLTIMMQTEACISLHCRRQNHSAITVGSDVSMGLVLIRSL